MCLLVFKLFFFFYPITDHERPEIKCRYSSTLSSTSAPDRRGWSTPLPGRFTPGKDPVSIVLEARWSSEPVRTGADNLASIGIRSPDRPGRSESLYQLSYPSPRCSSVEGLMIYARKVRSVINIRLV